MCNTNQQTVAAVDGCECSCARCTSLPNSLVHARPQRATVSAVSLRGLRSRSYAIGGRTLGACGVKEQPCGAQTRVLLALRHSGGAGAAQPAMEAGVAAPELLHPGEKPIGYTTTTDDRRKRIYGKPTIPRQHLQVSGVLDTQQLSKSAARIEDTNPGRPDPADQHHSNAAAGPGQGQDRHLAAARHIDLQALRPSINRLAKTK